MWEVEFYIKPNNRCPVGYDRKLCEFEEPELHKIEEGHWISCHYPGELTLR